MSTNVYSKLLYRALKLKDNKLLQSLVNDYEKVYTVRHVCFSLLKLEMINS